MLKPWDSRKYFFAGLIAITILYTVYNIYFADSGKYYHSVPRNIRHAISFASVLLVYLIGLLALRKYTLHWMILIWHFLYAAATSILIGIGGYEWYTGLPQFQLANLARTLHEFLISPVPYAGITIISRKLTD